VTPADSEAEFLHRISGPLDQLTVGRGIDEMLRFYADQRADGTTMDEDGDMLLFQWGTYDFVPPPTFQLNITRQFILPDAEETYQLSLTFHYLPTGQMQALKEGNKWCYRDNGLAAFRDVVNQSEAISATVGAVPLRVELRFNQC